MDTTREVLQAAVGHLYDLERELGGGGMARVWLARDKSLGRRIVIKVLDPQIAAAVSMARFRREIELCARLQHPQIVPLLSAGDAGGVPYFTMPYVEGESLRSTIHAGDTPAPSQVLHILGDVALALDYAHRHGVVHRDVKPENILLVGRSAMVTDFGIAKALTDATDDGAVTLTSAGVSVGTPAYMAPEQHSADRIDQRTDLYAWGLVAYELVAGVHPFAHCRSPSDYIRAHLTEAPRPLIERAPGIAASLNAVVMQCLEKAPEKRPGSALDIIKVLELLGGVTGGHAALPDRPRVPRVAWIASAAVVVAAAGMLAWRSSRAPMAPAATSIAVIPFANASADSSQDYFADGMTDELSTELGRVPGVRVASRTAAYRYKGRRDLDVREVRRTLGVDAVVQGTIRRASNRWRVSAQLTSASTGEEIWSERFDREAHDVFAVQDEISAAVARALRIRLTSELATGATRDSSPGGQRPVPLQGTRDPVAYDLYLRGRYLLERRGPTVRRAVDLFQQAIDQDSMFARAHASRALALLLVPFYADAALPAVLQQAEESARRSLELDPRLADGHLALAGVYRLEWKWAESISEFRAALDLDPQNVPARLNYAQMLYAAGDPDASLAQARQAKALDPNSPLALLGEARAITLTGRHGEVVALIERALELDPTLPQTRVYLAMALLRLGDPARALATIDSATAIPSAAAEAAFVVASAGSRQRVEGLFRQLQAQTRPSPFQHTTRALAYLGAGDTLRALDAFEVAAKKRELIPLNLGFVDPIYDPIRGSSRFAEIVRSYGLDPRRFISVVRSRGVTGSTTG